MEVLGIIAEYDPFHNGHLYHLRSAVSAAAPSAVIVALSGVFRQRGGPAVFSPFVRAECALDAGADAVVSLPVLWTVRDAEHYALGAVFLLSSLGATHLAFGAENADLPLLQQTADLLEDQPEPFRGMLRGLLAEGTGYPAALARAAGSCIPECEALLNRPNNILAVCYLRAVRRLGVSLTPVIIPRIGSYHSECVSPVSPSASAVCASLRRGAWQDALSALPPFSQKAVRAAFLSGTTPDPKKLDAVLLARLRSMTPGQAALLPDCGEGLGAALLKASAAASSREELISLLTTRRYSASRISRLCTYALLGITGKRLSETALPDSALLLAIRKNPSLTGPWKSGPVRVRPAAEWLEKADPADAESFRIWGMCSGLSGGFPCTERTVTR